MLCEGYYKLYLLIKKKKKEQLIRKFVKYITYNCIYI